MSTKVGDIFVRANLNDKQYKKGLANLEKYTGISLKRLGKAFTVAGLGLFVKKATEAGASLNAMGTIIDASLPHMTKQVDEFAKSAGAMFGLSETQAKGFVGKFASMASAMGYTEEQAYNMSTALTGLAGDVASYYHISSDDAYAKLGAVFTGETEALKQLGVVMTQNALDAFALEKGYGAVTSQMSELEKTTLRYQFVMDRLKLASGDFAKYANTWSGSLATIKLNWSNFMATIGQGMINILLPLLQLIARVSNALSALGSRFVAWTKAVRGIKTSVSSAIGKQTQKELKTANTGVSNLGDSIGGAGKKAKGTKKQIQALKKELLGFDKITKLTKQDASTGTGGAGGVGGGGGIDIGDIEDATTATTALGEAVDYLKNLSLPPALSEALSHLKEALGGFFDVLKTAGQWAFENVLKPLGQWLINNGLPVVIDGIATAVELITNVLKALGSVLEPLWNAVIRPLFEFLGDVAIVVVQGLTTVLGTLSKGVEKATEGWDKIKTNIEAIKNAWVTLKDKAGDIKATATLKLSDSFTSAWNKVKGAWNGIKNKTATMKLKFTEGFKSIWNGLAKKVNAGRTKSALLKTLFPKPVPLLAQGGYVKANTPQLAVIGDNKREGEIVAPESKLRAMVQEVAGQNNNAEVVALLRALLVAVQTQDNNVYLDGEQIKNNVVRRINNHTRATGQLELIV